MNFGHPTISRYSIPSIYYDISTKFLIFRRGVFPDEVKNVDPDDYVREMLAVTLDERWPWWKLDVPPVRGCTRPLLALLQLSPPTPAQVRMLSYGG
ncbi:hypothetical protein C8Q78DRAFT_1010869 [Trametes maxima]|nr:hypothetical protein C8Q78DRAFT_1010869 [Trametes maxima]